MLQLANIYDKICVNMDIKENLAKNLTACRKAFNLTQAELAEKLNYSDKAVSKWERGESVPDIVVLKQLADFYGITIDKLISENKAVKPKIIRHLGLKRTLISLCSLALVWLIAIISFVVCNNLEINFEPWLIFIYAIPVSCIICIVFASAWKSNLINTVCISVLVWSIILCLYLTLEYALPIIPVSLWQMFLVGIPIQLILIFVYILKRLKKIK